MKKLLTFLSLLLGAHFAQAQPCAGLASFTTSINNMTLQVTNTGAATPPWYITSAYWNFGDGTTMYTWGPHTHTYANPGSYTVLFAVMAMDSSNNQMCIDTSFTVVTVSGVPTNAISGTIYWDSTLTQLGHTDFKVWLIEHDAVANTLTAIDSANVNGYLAAYYNFSNVTAGNYLVKAAQVTTTGPAVLMPTYHHSSLFWNNAQTVVHTGGNTLNKDIYMIAGTPLSGPGFVGGNISQGANKGTTGGLPGIQVFVRDAANTVLAVTYTDASGDYSFGNLPAGSYTIYPEEMSYQTTPSASLTISTGNASVTGVDFEKSDISNTIYPKTTGIGNLPVSNLATIYPNPVRNGIISINWDKSTQESADIIVTDMSGRILIQQTSEMKEVHQLNASQLSTGIYLIHITTGNAQYTGKVVIQ